MPKEDLKQKILNKFANKAGRAAAINGMCCSCIYDPDAIGAGSWRKQVEDCTSTVCPLYKYRPCTTGGKSDNEEDTEDGS